MRITKDFREWEEFHDFCLRRLRRSSAWAVLGFAGLGAARTTAGGGPWEAPAATALLLGLSAWLAGRTSPREGNFRLAWLAVAALGAFAALNR